ncbi:UDP-4-amino-4,6-dideoxy-N-acetyl-beta-L-altrosamine transaminase [soil metagenome]
MAALVKPALVAAHLPYGKQTIDESDIEAVVEALRAPMLTCGPLVAKFEKALAAYVGAPYATACSSGTAALHLIYAALNIGPGDEIITTPITFSATAHAAYYVGATVRIADVDPRTGNMTPASVEALVTPKTRAIVAVHLGGLPVDLAEIQAIAKKHGVLMIEDACHALGATYRGVKIGGSPDSDAVIFSFHPVKHVTTGEGGAIITRHPELKRRLEKLRQHGIERDAANFEEPAEGPWAYEVQELGFNYRLPDINCALGISQLAKIDDFVEARREIAAEYRRQLPMVFSEDAVAAPAELADRESAHHLFAIAVDWQRFGTTRAQVVKQLAAAGIGTQVHYIPLLKHPLHAARCPDEVARARPGVDHYFPQTLSLPLFPTMTAADVTRVVDELHRALGEIK